MTFKLNLMAFFYLMRHKRQIELRCRTTHCHAIPSAASASLYADVMLAFSRAFILK